MSYFLHPMVDPDMDVSDDLIGHGRPYSVGAASGTAVFSAEEALARSQKDHAEPCILIAKACAINKDNHFAAGVDAASGSITALMSSMKTIIFPVYTILLPHICYIIAPIVQECC